MSRQPECPLCGEPAAPLPANPNAPFCSRGCRDRDLLNWLDERYVVPQRQSTDEED